MTERHIRWWTPHLSRDFEMLVFGEGRGLPLILFPTAFGNYRQNKDFHLTDACSQFVDSGRVTTKELEARKRNLFRAWRRGDIAAISIDQKGESVRIARPGRASPHAKSMTALPRCQTQSCAPG